MVSFLPRLRVLQFSAYVHTAAHEPDRSIIPPMRGRTRAVNIESAGSPDLVPIVLLRRVGFIQTERR